MKLIGQAHTLVHQNGVLRVQTDIRIGTRTDKKQHFSEKVTKVESILAADGQAAEKKVVTTERVPETGTAKEQQPAQSPRTNNGTWASMFRK